MTSTDAFVGTWELDATQNQYQFGDAPQQGLYIIAPKQHGYLVTMQWTNSAGKSFEMSYEATPDGKEYPANVPGIDKQSMTRVNDKILDSVAIAGETVIAFARRILSDDGQVMTITQSGKTPDGEEFANVSVYMRRA